MANLITNSTFETDATGWTTGASFAIAQDTTHAHGGTGSLKCTVGAASQGSFRAAAFQSVSVSTSTPYVVSCWVYIPSTWASGTPQVELYDFTNSTTLGNGVAGGTRDAWQFLSVVATTSAAANQGLRLATVTSGSNMVIGDAMWLDDASIDTPPSAIGRRLLLGVG